MNQTSPVVQNCDQLDTLNTSVSLNPDESYLNISIPLITSPPFSSLSDLPTDAPETTAVIKQNDVSSGVKMEEQECSEEEEKKQGEGSFESDQQKQEMTLEETQNDSVLPSASKIELMEKYKRSIDVLEDQKMIFQDFQKKRGMKLNITTQGISYRNLTEKQYSIIQQKIEINGNIISAFKELQHTESFNELLRNQMALKKDCYKRIEDQYEDLYRKYQNQIDETTDANNQLKAIQNQVLSLEQENRNLKSSISGAKLHNSYLIEIIHRDRYNNRELRRYTLDSQLSREQFENEITDYEQEREVMKDDLRLKEYNQAMLSSNEKGLEAAKQEQDVEVANDMMRVEMEVEKEIFNYGIELERKREKEREQVYDAMDLEDAWIMRRENSQLREYYQKTRKLKDIIDRYTEIHADKETGKGLEPELDRILTRSFELCKYVCQQLTTCFKNERAMAKYKDLAMTLLQNKHFQAAERKLMDQYDYIVLRCSRLEAELVDKTQMFNDIRDYFNSFKTRLTGMRPELADALNIRNEYETMLRTIKMANFRWFKEVGLDDNGDDIETQKERQREEEIEMQISISKMMEMHRENSQMHFREKRELERLRLEQQNMEKLKGIEKCEGKEETEGKMEKQEEKQEQKQEQKEEIQNCQQKQKVQETGVEKEEEFQKDLLKSKESSNRRAGEEKNASKKAKEEMCKGKKNGSNKKSKKNQKSNSPNHKN